MLEPRQSETPRREEFFGDFRFERIQCLSKAKTSKHGTTKIPKWMAVAFLDASRSCWCYGHRTLYTKALGKHHFQLRWLDFPPGSIYSKERWKSGSLSRQVQDKYVSKSHSFPKLARIKSSPPKRYVSCHFDYAVFDCQRHQHHLGGFGTSSCQPRLRTQRSNLACNAQRACNAGFRQGDSALQHKKESQRVRFVLVGFYIFSSFCRGKTCVLGLWFIVYVGVANCPLLQRYYCNLNMDSSNKESL